MTEIPASGGLASEPQLSQDELKSLRVLLDEVQSNRSLQWLLFVFAGIALGYLIGLSEAPVIQATIATILAALIAVSAAFGNALDSSGTDRRKLSASLTAYMVIGMALGASFGIWIRDSGALTPQPSQTNSASPPSTKTSGTGGSTGQSSTTTGGATPQVAGSGVQRTQARKPSVLKSHKANSAEGLEAIRTAQGVNLVNALEINGDNVIRQMISNLQGKTQFTPVEKEQLEVVRKIALGEAGG